MVGVKKLCYAACIGAVLYTNDVSAVKSLRGANNSKRSSPTVYKAALSALMLGTCPMPTDALNLRANWRPLAKGFPVNEQAGVYPRSGGMAFLNPKTEEVMHFGGYTEPVAGIKEEQDFFREAVNDLISFKKDEFSIVEKNDPKSAKLPPPRMFTAGDVLNDYMYMVAGWNPAEKGSGGIFLDDVYRMNLATNEFTKLAEPMLDGAVSRHQVVTVGNTLIAHTHRCVGEADAEKPSVDQGKKWDAQTRKKALDVEKGKTQIVETSKFEGMAACDIKAKIYRFDEKLEKFVEQETTGEYPDARGLHTVTAIDDTHMIVFGGAAQTGQMKDDAYILDTTSWKWSKVDYEGEGARPQPRAGPCSGPLPENDEGAKGMIMYGGSFGSQERGLVSVSDVWYLKLNTEDLAANKDTIRGTWELLKEDGAENAPPGRTSPTFTPLSLKNDQYLVANGWDPKGAPPTEATILEIKQE